MSADFSREPDEWLGGQPVYQLDAADWEGWLVTRTDIVGAVRAINPPEIAGPPLACCSRCASSEVDAVLGGHVYPEEINVVFWAARADGFAFGPPGAHVLRSSRDADGRPILLKLMAGDEGALLEPLALEWRGDRNEIARILRDHLPGVEIVVPDVNSSVFHVAPWPPAVTLQELTDPERLIQ